MRAGTRFPRVRRLPTLLLVVVGLAASGCSGLRIHRPQDLANAQAAQTAFQAADLADTVTAERARLDKVLAEELELIRKHALARRDARLIYIIGEGDSTTAWNFLEADIQDRVKELGLDDQSFAATLAKIAQLPTAKAALRQSRLEYEAFRAAHPSLPVLSCPLPPDFDEAGLAGTGNAQDAFEDYKFNCQTFLSINTIPSKNGQEIQRLRQAQAAAAEAGQNALDAVSQARSEYADALNSAGPDQQALKRQRLLDAFASLGNLGNQLQGIREGTITPDDLPNVGDLRNQLQKILDGEATLESLGLKEAAGDLEATLEKIRLEVEQGNVVAALSTALGNEEAQKWLFPRLQGENATKFVSALVDIGKTLEATEGPRPVTALLIRQEQLNLDIQAADQRQAFFDDVVELLEAQDQAAQDEVVYLGQAMRWLTDLRNSQCLTAEGTPTGGIAQLLATGTQEKCRERVFRLLVAYSSSWTFGRVQAEQIDQRIVGLHQQAALDASEIALAKWQSLFGLPIGQLVALYETGVRPQDLLDILNLVGLGAIAVGVN
jgi:hypothetical protein